MSLNKILGEIRDWRSRPSQRERLRARALDKEVPDPVPLALPVGYETPPTMTELIQRYVRLEVSQQASADGHGSFDEEDDFSLEDHNPLPMEQYEVNEYQMEDDPDMPSVEGSNPDVTAPAVVDQGDSPSRQDPLPDPLPNPGNPPQPKE